MIRSLFNADFIISLNQAVMGNDGLVLNRDLIESTYSSVDYYPTELEQVVSVFRSIIKNHAFKDGNKRTAYLFLVCGLNELGYQTDTKINEIEWVVDFVVLNATTTLSISELVDLILNKLQGE